METLCGKPVVYRASLSMKQRVPSNYTKQLCPWSERSSATVVFLFTFKEMSDHVLCGPYDRVLFLSHQAANFRTRKLPLFGEYISFWLAGKMKIKNGPLRSGSKYSLTVSYNISNIFVRPIKPDTTRFAQLSCGGGVGTFITSMCECCHLADVSDWELAISSLGAPKDNEMYIKKS